MYGDCDNETVSENSFPEEDGGQSFTENFGCIFFEKRNA